MRASLNEVALTCCPGALLILSFSFRFQSRHCMVALIRVLVQFSKSCLNVRFQFLHALLSGISFLGDAMLRTSQRLVFAVLVSHRRMAGDGRRITQLPHCLPHKLRRLLISLSERVGGKPEDGTVGSGIHD